jgi:hypothetical protein
MSASDSCAEFRGRLADLLSGRSGSRAAFVELAWHEHLLACTSCRELIEAEEALDELLASLPEPHLPPALTRRLLARLEPIRADAELDLLLDRSEAEPAPAALARNVLAKLAGPRRAEREDRALERLLTAVPEPAAPAGLAARVLAGLAEQRPASRAPGKAAPVRRDLRPARRIAVAAALLVGVGAAAWLARERLVPRPDGPEDARVVAGRPAAPAADELIETPSEELLASLDLLESWDLLVDAGVEADVNALGPVDELLLGLETDGRAR